MEIPLQYGLVGGRIQSGFYQGEMAAELTLRLLEGKERADDISPLIEDTCQYMFSYPQLKKWNIPEKSLPKGSVILEKPVSNYQKFKIYFWGLGSVIALLTAALSVTILNNIKRRQLENRIKKSEAHLRAVLDNVPDLIWFKDPDGVFLSCNKRFERLYNAKEEEIIGKTDYDFVDQDLADFFRNNDQAAMAVRTIHINEEELIYADDGHHEILETIKTSVFSDDEQLIGVLGIGRNITERKVKERVQSASLSLIDLSSDHTIKAMLQKVMETAEELTKSPFGFYHFVNQDQKTLSLQFWSDNTPSHADTMEDDRPCVIIETDIWADCIKEGIPVIHHEEENKSNEGSLPESDASIIRDLVVPVIRDQKICAVLGVINKSTPYEENDIKAIHQLADLTWELIARKRSDEKLEKSKALQKSILQAAMDGFVRVDTKGIIFEINPAYCYMTGYHEAELLRKNISFVEANDTKQEISQRIASIMASGEGRFETVHKRKDGTLMDVEVLSQYREDDGGQFISFIRDISDRKEQERALTFQALLLDQIQDHITATDLEGNIIYVNEAQIRFMKKQKAELLGRPVSIYGADSSRDEVHQKIINTTLKNGQWEGEIVNYCDDGTELLMELRAKLIRDKSGKPVSMIGIGTDITEQKKLSERLQQAQKMESIGSLAGGIAHDFNNILFPIIGLSELLLEDFDPQSVMYENIREILKAGQRGAALVDQILSFSRQTEHQLIPIHIQQILKEVLKLTRATIPSNIEIAYQLQPNCGMVMADPVKLHQVGMNIITNAFHAVETDGGRITVELNERVLKESDLTDSSLLPGKYAHLQIADNGVGMSKEIMGKMFDPYFTTKKPGKGTGLGLATVYGIIKEYNGDIKVESEIGKGTTFHIFFPVMESNATNVKTTETDHLLGGDERILIVDDEISIVNIETKILERLGYQVTSFTNSMDALKAITDTPYHFDLLITDMTMPHLTGHQLVKRVLKIREDLPIIICTGFSEQMDDDMAKTIGAMGLLKKPIIKSQLAKMIRNILTKSSVNPKDILVRGG